MRPVGCVADPQTAGFRRRGRDPLSKASLQTRSCFDANSCWSDAVENLETPQHDDDGRYQGGNGQHTLQGSHSHDTLRFPTPSSGLVDSRNRRQSAGYAGSEVILRLWFAGHSCSRQQKARWPRGPLSRMDAWPAPRGCSRSLPLEHCRRGNALSGAAIATTSTSLNVLHLTPFRSQRTNRSRANRRGTSPNNLFSGSLCVGKSRSFSLCR